MSNLGVYGASGHQLPSSTPYICLKDQKTSATEGGTFTSGAWQTRTLNTIHADSHNLLLSLSNNQFTLPAGTYRVGIVAPAYGVDRHALRLQNITLGTTTLSGACAYALPTGSGQAAEAYIKGRIQVYTATTFEVQHRCQSTKASNGFGLAAGTSFTVDYEVFSVAEIWREA